MPLAKLSLSRERKIVLDSVIKKKKILREKTVYNGWGGGKCK